MVKGLTLKTWAWFSHILGDKESWMRNGKLVDIQKFWDWNWKMVRENESALFDAIPQYLLNEESRGKGFEYPGGEQWFWGFQGSQAGLSFPKDDFIYVGGWDEGLDIDNKWLGEDAEFGSRMNQHGVVWIEAPNIRAVHIYHRKSPPLSNKDIDRLVERQEADRGQKVANVDKSWGSADHMNIREVTL